MDQIEASRYAGKVNRAAIEHGFSLLQPGVSLLEIDAAVEKYILDHNCLPIFKGYRGFPNTCCLSPNDVVVHGVPTDYRLKDGDILTIDTGCSYEGWMVDSARTKVLRDLDKLMATLENPYRNKEQLVFASECVLEAQLSVIKSGCSLLDILKASELAAKENFGSRAKPSPTLNIYPQWHGHQIGRTVHMDPSVPSCIDSNLSKLKRWQLEREYDKYKLQTGQVFCLEPVVTFGKTDIILGEDGWTVRSADGSLAAHSESCIIVTETGFEILS